MTNNPVAQMMLDVMETLKPMEEAARGYKADLIRNEWTTGAAERIAARLLIEMNAAALRGVGR